MIKTRPEQGGSYRRIGDKLERVAVPTTPPETIKLPERKPIIKPDRVITRTEKKQ
jgi:hypothetical protein